MPTYIVIDGHEYGPFDSDELAQVQASAKWPHEIVERPEPETDCDEYRYGVACGRATYWFFRYHTDDKVSPFWDDAMVGIGPTGDEYSAGHNAGYDDERDAADHRQAWDDEKADAEIDRFWTRNGPID